MFNIDTKTLVTEFNMPDRTVRKWKNEEGYRKEIVDIFSDLIVLEELAKKDLKEFTDAELSYIVDSIDDYFTYLLTNASEKLNDALIELVESSEKIKKLTEDSMLNDYLEPEQIKTLMYKIDKNLDKLSRYFLVRERYEDVANYLKSVKKNGEPILKD